ncbi:MAG: hypothetical protein JSV09_03845 [Thermoplasmata archaeon]|nr:MAG: hypothetical protein JSV09_03845 [Thermoplasmata archaeon]
MDITTRTSLANILTFVFGLYLMLFSLFSFVSFSEFITYGRVDYQNFHIPCGTVFVIVFTLVVWILNLFNAINVYKTVKLKLILRILYIFLIYPGIIFVLIIASFIEALQIILIGAFPIFFIGVFLLPVCSYIIYSETLEEIERRISQIECFNCRYEFDIDPEDKEKECPLCGAKNKIPFK